MCVVICFFVFIFFIFVLGLSKENSIAQRFSRTFPCRSCNLFLSLSLFLSLHTSFFAFLSLLCVCVDLCCHRCCYGRCLCFRFLLRVTLTSSIHTHTHITADTKRKRNSQWGKCLQHDGFDVRSALVPSPLSLSFFSFLEETDGSAEGLCAFPLLRRSLLRSTLSDSLLLPLLVSLLSALTKLNVRVGALHSHTRTRTTARPYLVPHICLFPILALLLRDLRFVFLSFFLLSRPLFIVGPFIVCSLVSIPLVHCSSSSSSISPFIFADLFSAVCCRPAAFSHHSNLLSSLPSIPLFLCFRCFFSV